MAGLFLRFKDTGDHRIDMQHAHLLAIVSEFEDLMRTGESRGDKLALMSELMYYASTHFLDEENLMDRCGFPGVEEQRRLHAEFGVALSREISRFVEDRSLDGGDVLTLARTWIIEHIEIEDACLADYLHQTRAAAAS